MSKAVLNQRYIYKINSSLIKRNKNKVEMKDITKDFKNRYIVGIGDSTGLRIIRNINESLYTEEYINNIKINTEELKTRKHLTSNEKRDIKKQMRQLSKDKLTSSLETDLCSIVFDSDKHYDELAKTGFYINDIKYTLLIGTTGGVKQSAVLFINEYIYDELMLRLENGYDKTVPMLPSKLMAYLSLCFSSSTPVTNTKRILVVKDINVGFKDDITFIKFNTEKNQPDIFEMKDTDVEINACDGCGLIDDSNDLEGGDELLADKWDKELQLGYRATSYCIRHAFTKGILTRFNFKRYCKEVLHVSVVEDVWGVLHNIDDIDIIINESMLKLHKAYKNLNDYLDKCEKNGHAFAITKATPKVLDSSRRLNYQYVQCVNLNDKNLDNLLSNDINEIKDVIGLDYRKSILFGKGTDLNEENVWNNFSKDDLHIKALMIDGETIKDDYIKYKLKRAIAKRIDQLKTGKINVEGNYQIAIGEPIIQLQSMCGIENPQGLLNKNEFYIEYWREKNIKQVGGFRSPMSCKSNARKMDICNREEVIKWYGKLNNIIVFNARDTAMLAFNGEDFDGDINFTTSNKLIIDGIYDLPAILCEGGKSDPKTNITKDDFVLSIKKSFGNKVGTVTNFGSSCYDKLSLFEEGSKEYEELDYRIKCTQFYQQECIDSVKNGEPPKPIPKHWHDYHCEDLKFKLDEETKEILNTDEEIEWIEFNRSILTEKKPYYFIYIYDDLMKQYNEFAKNTATNCARRFRCRINELQPDNKEKEEFLEWYNKKAIVNNNPCIVNKIAKKIEIEFPRIPNVTNEPCDFNLYLNNTKEYEIGTNLEIKGLKELYGDYKKSKKNNICMDYNEKDDVTKETGERDDAIKIKAHGIIVNKDTLLRTLLNLAYERKSPIVSKAFVWAMVGGMIISNMLNNNGKVIKYPIKNDDGDMRYGYNKFSMVEKIIE